MSKNRGDDHTFWLACRNGQLETVKDLINRPDADVNTINVHGVTPLWIACRNGHKDIVKLLLKKRVEIDKPELVYQSTPLWIACRKGYYEIVKHLVENGAALDLTAWDNASFSASTPRAIAEWHGHKKIANFLLCAERLKFNRQDPAQVIFDLLKDYSRAEAGNRQLAAASRFFHGQWGNHYGDLVCQSLLNKNLVDKKNYSDSDVAEFFSELYAQASKKGVSLNAHEGGMLCTIINFARDNKFGGFEFDMESKPLLEN